MISFKVGDEAIVVDSNWDSGVHLGFTVGCVDKYTVKSTEKLLSREQIEGLEYTIAVLVTELLEGE